MTNNTENPTWGEEPAPGQSPAPDGNGWSGRKTLAAVAVAVGIAAAGGGVIWAAGGTDAAQLGGPRGYGMPGGPGFRLMGPAFGDAPHGEFQVGEVTEVSDSSISVRSTDGYTKTYVIDSETVIGSQDVGPMQDGGGKQDIAEGDTVTVISTTADGGESTAETITEGDVSRQRRGGQGNGQQAPPTR